MRLLTTALAALAASILIAPAHADTEADGRAMRQALAYAQQGLHALEKGNRARAMDDFKRALSQVPDLPEAHMGLGHVAMQERRFEDALAEFRSAQVAYRSVASRRVDLAQNRYQKSRETLQQLKDDRSAVEHERARQASGLGSDNNQTGMSDGRMQREAMELDRQINALESQTAPALDGVSDEPPAALYFFEANALFNLQRLDEAIGSWERAVDLDPKYAPAYNNLAVAYWKKGRLQDAQSSLARADRLGFKVNPRFRDDLAKAIAQSGASSP